MRIEPVLYGTHAGATPAAVLFDLDDTLFPQRSWLTGAWRAVATRAAGSSVEPDALLRALLAVAAQGSDRGHVIDRALQIVGARDVPVEPLVDAFRRYAPDRLDTYPGTHRALTLLGRRVPLALVTDGDPLVQHNKLRALGLAGRFTVMVFSDELGREHRKPDPLPFRVALDGLGVEAADAVYVGDRPEKDVAGARAAGIRCIRVRTGEYRAAPDVPRPWATVRDVVDAIRLLDAPTRLAG
ncbi:MAG TPA: HAD family hydrolase [Acidimicrobiia bacterium]|nr:HAD family hydrolase [Acidimicrobiia bacterium]